MLGPPVIGRALGAVCPCNGPLPVPTARLPCLIHAHNRADLPWRTFSHRMACPLGSCGSMTFNIRNMLYGFNPFFYPVSREIFQCQFCFSVDILNIFNYCLYPWCMRVSAETMRRPGERPWGRRALQGARRARAEGELTCVNVPGLSLTTSSRTSLRPCSTICLPPG